LIANSSMTVIVVAIALGCAASPGAEQRRPAAPAKSVQDQPKQNSSPRTAANESTCRDIRQREQGWAEYLKRNLQGKAAAEARLANCRMQEKDRRTLPGQCDQFALQVQGAEREVQKANQEMKNLEQARKHYNCP
jgi:hypothetical protein